MLSCQIILTATCVALLAGCTHANVSSLPMHSQEHGEVYRYQGRANFSHQMAEADKTLIEHCAKLNGGRPVVVNVQKQYLGDVAIGNANSTTIGTAVATGGMVTGSAMTTGTGSVTTLRNYNQEILFKCVPAATTAPR